MHSSKVLPTIFFCIFSLFIFTNAFSQKSDAAKIEFTVSMNEPASHLYHVILNYQGAAEDSIEFKMPVWTTGYYQLMNYADNVSAFKATDSTGKALEWKKKGRSSWLIESAKHNRITISYEVKAVLNFVAGNYLDENKGFISPAGLFLYPANGLKNEVSVIINPYKDWNNIATGLERTGKRSFVATDYDVLYDSPILIGNLVTLDTFYVNNIPHYFQAYKPGEFDQKAFITDLSKIVTTASSIIGDIPYKHYSFIAIGPGGGGTEHLNSAAVSFSGKGLDTKQGQIRMYSFLAHEYFHHYNVKRIRPIELGPFNYDKENRTKMLWLSEGITVYYEYIILRRAGLINDEELFQLLQRSIKAYEEKPGRNFQTPADASYQTWEEGPFGRTGDDVNKTISPYDKGPLLGILLDFKIRQATKNKKSFDDLMRLLYNKYYKELGRGFTEAEFRKEAETISTTKLDDFFSYIYTLKKTNYSTYFGYAGLTIDTILKAQPGAWFGANVEQVGDTLVVKEVEYNSPAWKSGLRKNNKIMKMNGEDVNDKVLGLFVSASKAGDVMKLSVINKAENKELLITLATKKEASYEIKKIVHPNAMQQAILNGWLGEQTH